MVRTCQADEGVQAQVDSLLERRATAEVGLLIGKLGAGSRDFLLGLIASPDNDGHPAVTCQTAATKSKPSAGKKASKPQAGGVDVDTEWVVEHARQVGRMLPGGLRVVGAYLFGPEVAFQQASSLLSQLAAECAEVSKVAAPDAEDSSAPEALLFLADSGSRKVSVKVCGSDGGLQPAELRLMPLLESFVPLVTRVDVCLEVPAACATGNVAKHLRRVVAAESQRISSSRGMLGSVLPADGALLADIASTQKDPGTPLAVSLLCPPAWAAAPVGDLMHATEGPGRGMALIKGTMECRAYAYKRETWVAAIQELKADAMATLQTRLEMVLELEEDMCGEDGEGAESSSGSVPSIMTAASWGASFRLPFPRRVSLPWKGGLELSDYLHPGDTEEDAREHSAMMLSMDSAAVEVKDWEAPPRSTSESPLTGQWEPLAGASAAGQGQRLRPSTPVGAGGRASPASCTMAALMAAAGVAGLAAAYLAASLS